MAEEILHGIGVSEGIAIGKACVFEHLQTGDTGRNISEKEVLAEVGRLKEAVIQATDEVENLIKNYDNVLGKDKIGVIKGQKGFLSDPAFCPEMEKMIRTQLFSAEKAVKEVTEKFSGIFENSKNDYMKERACDIRDAEYRLLNILSGKKSQRLSEISSPVILIADDLTPSDTIQLNKKYILAFATQKGGKTSHTSIFAKSMGIPAVVGIKDIVASVTDGDAVLLDGSQGTVVVSPRQETVREYEEKINAEIEKRQLLEEYMFKDAVTRDGEKIIVAANIGSAADAIYVLQMGAEAVGLLRTEQMYLSKNALPDETDQFLEYKKIAETFSQKEVVVRTLDIGGDKALGYLNIPKEENPFMGYRAIRVCLDRESLFLTQLRAILRASAFGKLAVMFPMISNYEELVAAKAVFEKAKSQLKAENILYDENIRVGIMVEIPSAAIMADILATEADFFSIGTNDLTQYSLAVDRGNEKISSLYDYFDPSVIRLIKNVSDAAHARGIPVGMCGDMAGDPIALPLLIGLDLDELSMTASSIGKAKYVITKLNKGDCKKLASEAVKCKSAKKARILLSEFYQQHIDK